MICSFHVKSEALRYKPEGLWFDSRLCRWDFPLTRSFWPHYGCGIDSAPDKNEYQEFFLTGKGGRCVGLTTLPTSCADCHVMWGPQPPGTLKSCPALYRDSFLHEASQSQYIVSKVLYSFTCDVASGGSFMLRLHM